MVAPLVVEGSRHSGSVIAHGLSCPTACGIFLDQGLNQWHTLHPWITREASNFSLLKSSLSKIMPLAATWMDLDMVILSEARQTEEKYCICYPLYAESKKK